MDDSQTLRSMVRDDAYRVVRVLSDGPSGRTELVTLDGEGPLVRKSMPAAIANATAWAIAMELDEPLLPRIESLYRMPDKLVVVYEYVPGDSLRELVERDGRLARQRAVDIVSDVCRAVSALHGRGVIHRDITPGNVIVAPDGAHLVDLGIARQHTEGQEYDTTRLGTWGFAAPEQFGFAQTDARSDVYALGRLLGYLLTGERPDTEAYGQVLADTTVVEPAMAAVVEHATQFEPSARPQDVNAFAAELTVASDACEQAAHADAPSENPLMEEGQDREDAGQEQTETAGLMAVPTYQPEVDPSVPARDYTRSFGQAPLWPRLMAIVCWVASSFWVLIVVGTVINEARKGWPNWGAAQHMIGTITVAGVAMLSFEVYRMVTHRGPYNQERLSPQFVLSRLAAVVAVTFFALFLMVFMYSLVTA